MGLHTLCLLDIKKDLEKYMTVNEAIEILLKIESKRGENVFTNETFCVGCARLGGDFVIKAGKASELLKFDFGKPLHCLIVPGKMHFMEEDILSNFK
jgi:diphthine synthase